MIISGSRGAWVAQSVKHPTLGFSLGHELTVCEFKPYLGLCADSAEPAWDSLSFSLSLSLPPSLPLPLFPSLSAPPTFTFSLKNKLTLTVLTFLFWLSC